jgi:hypothetical protein
MILDWAVQGLILETEVRWSDIYTAMIGLAKDGITAAFATVLLQN